MAEAQDYLVDEGREVFGRLLREKRRLERQDAVVVDLDGDSSSEQSEDSSEPDLHSAEEDEETPMEGFLS